MDQVVKAIAADDGAARPGLVGKDAHQDQVMLLAILLGHTALLVDRAFLLVATRVAEVARHARAGRKWAVVLGGSLASHGKHFTTKTAEMGKQYAYLNVRISD